MKNAYKVFERENQFSPLKNVSHEIYTVFWMAILIDGIDITKHIFNMMNASHENKHPMEKQTKKMCISEK